MPFIGHQCDAPAAYRATRSCLVGDDNLAMVDANLSTVAVAEATAEANALTLNIAESVYFGVNVARGFRIASNLGGTFGSTFSALYASLPENSGLNKSMMISGS